MQRLCERLRYVRSALIEHLDEGNPEVIHFKVHVPHTCLTSARNTSTVTESRYRSAGAHGARVAEPPISAEPCVV
jgi:hypothetical protein